jgi:eukaryotic-like serine/threonine-protein kinase
MPAPEFLEGKYDVISKIREGGMGAIYQVRHRLLREMRVVKVMHPQVASSAEQRKRFVREAQTATRLKHPNIVTFYDFAIDPDGTAYMVMEYVDGTDLADLVRRVGPIPVPMGLVLLKQCLSALAYLHKRSIVHRDVSPDNILLCRDEDGEPQAKLIDLGIAKVARDREGLTAADEFLGKLRYASPEQLTGPTDGPIDGRSDLYSLAAVAYEILTGVCPFRGKSLQSILAAHLSGPPISFDESDPEKRVPDELRRALLRALEIRPEDRFPSAEEFSKALESLSMIPSGSETGEFLDRALGPAHKERDTDATAVHLPPPPAGAGGETEMETHVGGPRPSWASGGPSPAARLPSASRTESPVLGESRPAAPVQREPERTQLYERGTRTPAKKAAARLPLLYAAIVAAAIAGLALLWIRSEAPIRSALTSGKTIPSVTGGAGPGVQPTLQPTAFAMRSAETPVVLPAESSSDQRAPVERPTASVETTEPPLAAPTPVTAAQLQPTPRRLRQRPAPRADLEPTAPFAAAAPALEAPKTLYCATVGRTSYTQATSEEKPHGFVADSAQAFRGPRTDAARIHIDVLVQPLQPREGEPFLVTAKLFNDGSMDLIVRKIEESTPTTQSGYRAVDGADPGAIGIGGYRQIYTYRGTLSAGGTYRKDLLVTDSTGDSWRTSIQIVPCR